ncbi:hypothetical protein ACP3S8_23745 [Mixta calida]|uniref:hypothetical protein n=1 Tax=Mixta calida TaxID=665913 RepID=UPI003CEA6DE7
MSGFKGKPGPWHWEGKVLCNDEHIVGGDGWAFNDADKRLIAAATELLEACLRMRNQLYATGYEAEKGSLNPTKCLLAQVESAIAKALGNN